MEEASQIDCNSELKKIKTKVVSIYSFLEDLLSKVRGTTVFHRDE